jgi:hypothetical protein
MKASGSLEWSIDRLNCICNMNFIMYLSQVVKYDLVTIKYIINEKHSNWFFYIAFHKSHT